jgi:hypothetical protein
MIESYEKDSIISIVQGIQPIDYQYSKLGRIMNGYFKKRSLDYIQKNIDKKIHVHEYYDLPTKENQKKKNNFFNIDFRKIDTYLKEYSKINNLHHTYDTYKSCDDKNKIKKKIKKINLKKKIEITGLSKNQITADPGRYNPNFKSIFKNSYHAFFGSSQLKSNNQSNNSIDNNITKVMTNISKSKSQSILKTERGINLDETIQLKNNNDDIQSSNVINMKNNSYKNSIELPKSDRNDLNSKNSFSQIKSSLINFPDLYKFNKSRNNSKKALLTKSNSSKLLKKINASSIDFSKMSGRKNIFNINCTPIYSPNYKYNLPHLSTVRMPKEIPFQELKKIIIGKLIRTYKLNSDEYMIMEINRKYNNY